MEIHQFYMALAKSCGGACKDCKYWQRDRPPFHHAGVCLNEKRWLEKKAGIYIGECGMCEEFARREKADQ